MFSTLNLFRPFLLLTTILVAGMSAVRAKAPARVRTYLLAEFLTTLVLEWAVVKLDWRTIAYAKVYVAMRSIDLAAALWMARPKLMAWPLTLAAAWMVWEIMENTSLFPLIAFFTATIFLFAGLSLGLRVPFEPRPLAYGSIASMWCFLAVYGFGYAMSWIHPASSAHSSWQHLNEWWPSAICIFLFMLSAVGFRTRVPRKEIRYGT